MCFKHLPIEFDAHGNPRLKDNADGEPFAVRAASPERALEKIAKGEHLREVNLDPVTRVAGALAFHAVVDLENRRVVEAHTQARIFRGYELILKGRHPSDAIDISSRACGVCGGVHATTASLALEMAANVVPPPLAIILSLVRSARTVLADEVHLLKG
jgi:hydrogenase large subunit